MTEAVGTGVLYGIGILWVGIAMFIGIGATSANWQQIRASGKSTFVFFAADLVKDARSTFWGAAAVALLVLPFLLLLLGWETVRLPFTIPTSLLRFALSTKGVFSMKWLLRKLSVAMFLMSVGYTGSEFQLMSRLLAWYNAPPAPPSAEASRLIASLESADGWKADGMVDRNGNLNGFLPSVKRGDVKVVNCTFSADIYTGGNCVNGSFTSSETRAINKAAATCLRKLSAKAMEEAVAKK